MPDDRISRRGAKRFRVEISKVRGGGGGEVVARGLARVFRPHLHSKIWRNFQLHHLLTSGSSAVNGCSQNEKKIVAKNIPLSFMEESHRDLEQHTGCHGEIYVSVALRKRIVPRIHQSTVRATVHWSYSTRELSLTESSCSLKPYYDTISEMQWNGVT